MKLMVNKKPNNGTIGSQEKKMSNTDKILEQQQLVKSGLLFLGCVYYNVQFFCARDGVSFHPG